MAGMRCDLVNWIYFLIWNRLAIKSKVTWRTFQLLSGILPTFQRYVTIHQYTNIKCNYCRFILVKNLCAIEYIMFHWTLKSVFLYHIRFKGVISNMRESKKLLSMLLMSSMCGRDRFLIYINLGVLRHSW